MRAKGFRLLPWAKNVDVDFVGRHLLDPVKSTDEKYIKSEIRKQIKGQTEIQKTPIGQSYPNEVNRESDFKVIITSHNAVITMERKVVEVKVEKIRNVMQMVYEPGRLKLAWQQVKKNAGSAGIDRMNGLEILG